MDCLATSPVLSIKYIPFTTTNSKLGAGFHRIYTFSRENCEGRRRSNVAIKSSRGVSSLQTQQEPDIGHDSDDDDDEYDGEQEKTDEYEERIKKGRYFFSIEFLCWLT